MHCVLLLAVLICAAAGDCRYNPQSTGGEEPDGQDNPQYSPPWAYPTVRPTTLDVLVNGRHKPLPASPTEHPLLCAPTPPSAIPTVMTDFAPPSPTEEPSAEPTALPTQEEMHPKPPPREFASNILLTNLMDGLSEREAPPTEEPTAEPTAHATRKHEHPKPPPPPKEPPQPPKDQPPELVVDLGLLNSLLRETDGLQREAAPTEEPSAEPTAHPTLHHLPPRPPIKEKPPPPLKPQPPPPRELISDAALVDRLLDIAEAHILPVPTEEPSAEPTTKPTRHHRKPPPKEAPKPPLLDRWLIMEATPAVEPSAEPTAEPTRGHKHSRPPHSKGKPPSVDSEAHSVTEDRTDGALLSELQHFVELGKEPEPSAEPTAEPTRRHKRTRPPHSNRRVLGVSGDHSGRDLLEELQQFVEPPQFDLEAKKEVPTTDPTVAPTGTPTAAPTEDPTANPTAEPTAESTSAQPTSEPTMQPTSVPTAVATPKPTRARRTKMPQPAGEQRTRNPSRIHRRTHRPTPTELAKHTAEKDGEPRSWLRTALPLVRKLKGEQQQHHKRGKQLKDPFLESLLMQRRGERKAGKQGSKQSKHLRDGAQGPAAAEPAAVEARYVEE